MESLISNLIRPFRFHYSIFDLGKKITENYTREDSTVLNERGMKIQYSYFQCIGKNRASAIKQLHFNKTQQISQMEGKNSGGEVCVVYAHCNSGSRVQGLPLLPYVIEEGWNLCLFDFSGSGLSEGEYISLGHYQAYDLQAIISMIKCKNNDKIFLWGRSMGAATIICYLSQTKQIDSIIGCVLDSPYSNLWKLICEFGKSRVSLPEFVLEQVIELLRKKILKDHAFDIKSLDLIAKVHHIATPTMFITSKQDTFISCSHVIQLYKELGSQIKVLEYIQKQHNSPRESETICIGLKFIKDCLFEKEKKKKHFEILPKKKQYYNGLNFAEMIIKNDRRLGNKSVSKKKFKDFSYDAVTNNENQQTLNKTLKNQNQCQSKSSSNIIKRFHSFSYIGVNNISVINTEQNISPNVSINNIRIETQQSPALEVTSQSMASFNKKIKSLANQNKNASKSSANLHKSREPSSRSMSRKRISIHANKDHSLLDNVNKNRQLFYVPSHESIDSQVEEHFNPMQNKMKRLHKKQSNKFIKSSIVSINLKKSEVSPREYEQSPFTKKIQNLQTTFLDDSRQSGDNFMITSRFQREIEKEPKKSGIYWKESQKIGEGKFKSQKSSRIEQNYKEENEEDERRCRIKTQTSALKEEEQDEIDTFIPKDQKNKTQIFLNRKGSLNQSKKPNDKSLKQILSLFLPSKDRKQREENNQILKLDRNYKKIINSKKKDNSMTTELKLQKSNTFLNDSPRFGWQGMETQQKLYLNKKTISQKIQQIQVNRQISRNNLSCTNKLKIVKVGKQNQHINKSNSKSSIKRITKICGYSESKNMNKTNIIKIQLNKEALNRKALDFEQDDLSKETELNRIQKMKKKKKIKVNTLLFSHSNKEITPKLNKKHE